MFFILFDKWWWFFYLGSGKIINYISYCVVYSILVAFSLIVINMADKWKNRSQLLTYILFGVLGCVLIITVWERTVASSLSYTLIDWIIFGAPFITLTYSAEIKLLTYMRNMKHYILASTLSLGINKIDKKYRIFFRRYDKFPSGEKISFE